MLKEICQCYCFSCELDEIPKIIHFLCSSGFGVTSNEDNVVTDEKGNKQKMDCGTEKGKHCSKNHRTAGI